AGLESCPNDAQLAAIAGHDNWPRRFATDPHTGRSGQVKEKASPHAAVCCVAARAPKGRGELRLHWAVFLPLGQPERLQLDSCDWSVDCFFHGWFFPNSGRTAVEGINEDGPAPTAPSLNNSGMIRGNWNRSLAKSGTLPLLPAALAAITVQCDWDDQTAA